MEWTLVLKAKDNLLSICQCFFLLFFFFPFLEDEKIFIHWTWTFYVHELVKLLVYFVKYWNDIVLFAFQIFQYAIISIYYLNFYFTEIKTVWKSDRVSMYTYTVRPYPYRLDTHMVPNIHTKVENNTILSYDKISWT